MSVAISDAAQEVAADQAVKDADEKLKKSKKSRGIRVGRCIPRTMLIIL